MLLFILLSKFMRACVCQTTSLARACDYFRHLIECLFSPHGWFSAFARVTPNCALDAVSSTLSVGLPHAIQKKAFGAEYLHRRKAKEAEMKVSTFFGAKNSLLSRITALVWGDVLRMQATRIEACARVCLFGGIPNCLLLSY